MKSPTRFKDGQGLEARLFAAGLEEQPLPESLGRAAERLGLPAPLLATAAATASMTASPTAAGAVATAGKATTLGGLGLAGATKAALVGIGIGVGVAVGAATFNNHRAATSPTPASTSVVKLVAAVPRPGNSATLGGAPEPAPSVLAPVESALARPSAPTRNSEPLNPTTGNGAEHVATIGRFDDEGVVPPTNTDGLPSALPGSEQGVLSNPGVHGSGPAAMDPRLAREIESLDHARSLVARGQAAAALRELNTFEQTLGYSTLGIEAKLVQVDALLATGQRAQAARLARSLPWSKLSNPQRQRLEVLIRDKSQ